MSMRQPRRECNGLGLPPQTLMSFSNGARGRAARSPACASNSTWDTNVIPSCAPGSCGSPAAQRRHGDRPRLLYRLSTTGRASPRACTMCVCKEATARPRSSSDRRPTTWARTSSRPRLRRSGGRTRAPHRHAGTAQPTRETAPSPTALKKRPARAGLSVPEGRIWTRTAIPRFLRARGSTRVRIDGAPRRR